MHARQTSKKVKAALKARRMNGAHISSFAPLGYRWDPEQKGHLLVDPETKWIVEKIFDMAVHGMGAAKIMKSLIREKVPTPGYIHYVREGAYAHIYQNGPEKAQYAWNETKIRLILTDENYLGNSIHNKTSVKSFKLKKQTRNPASEWVRVEGTHEAIISKDVFDRVQKQIVSRRRQRRDGTTQIFAGLVKCADCGWTMHFARQNKGNHPAVLTAKRWTSVLCTLSATIRCTPMFWNGCNFGHPWLRRMNGCSWNGCSKMAMKTGYLNGKSGHLNFERPRNVKIPSTNFL